MPFEGAYAGVFRVDDTTREMNLHAGRRLDGVSWNIETKTIKWIASDGRVAEIQEKFEHAYDPRDDPGEAQPRRRALTPGRSDGCLSVGDLGERGDGRIDRFVLAIPGRAGLMPPLRPV